MMSRAISAATPMTDGIATAHVGGVSPEAAITPEQIRITPSGAAAKIAFRCHVHRLPTPRVAHLNPVSA
jgi:hypothetical protein